MKANTKVKQSWKPFLKLLKMSKLPWGGYILYIVVQLVISTIYTALPSVKGSIMAGEIEDTATITTYILVTVASSLIMVPVTLFAVWNDARTTRNLRQTIWKKLIHMPMSRIDSVAPTSLVSRVTTDTDNISYAISYVFNMIIFVYTLAITLVMIAGMNGTIALLMGLLIPLIILANIPSRYMHDAQHEAASALSKYTNFLAERLGALKQIKASCAEDKEDLFNDTAAKEYFRAAVRQQKLDFIAQPLIYGMDAVVQAVVLIYGGYLLSSGKLDSASMIALYSYSSSLSVYAYQFVFCWQYVKRNQGATRAISEFIQCEPEQMERKKSFAIPDADIKLENVSFAYESGEKVLENLNLQIPTGKVTAIVGPSGSGKTTVLKLLERIYQPTEGKLMFGDVPAEDIHLNEWRESFGMVPQSSPLLFGTIRDNITYGIDEGVSDEQLNSVMEASNVTEIVNKMADGLNTDVGDVGAKLSGGEKQRIALARMMIRDPEYLLLDEATSSLDAENEHKITEALSKLMEGRTSVVVAHNLRTIENADKIIFMEKGHVVAEGTHEQLYGENPTYRRYVDLQHA